MLCWVEGFLSPILQKLVSIEATCIIIIIIVIIIIIMMMMMMIIDSDYLKNPILSLRINP